MPPLELSKYHPHLAEELALQSPDKPFAHRQDSGMSWDSGTSGDDHVTSMAKVTPPTMSTQLHRWESAEVLSVDETPGHAPA